MQISLHIDKKNLHHAYLLEGDKNEIIPQVFSILEDLNIKTSANPDFYNLDIDSFKIDDARNLKSMTSDRSFSGEATSKKIFLISANSFLLEAQNSLLKVFEEPIENTHFFIVTPSTQIFIPTLLSRFFVIKSESASARQDLMEENTLEAEKFIKLPLVKRIDFLKELLAVDEDEEEGNEKDSPRARALRFLDNLEFVLHKKISKSNHIGLPYVELFKQMFIVRKYLRQPGSSAKSLMESVALGIPEKMI
ncbi:MAG: hypothetical protein AAB438_00090 [Patescibacteria group bacterium]